MDLQRLKTITDRIGEARIVIFGDFFLDKYLEVDPTIEERSIETDLPAHQIVGKRCQPGAAGTVTSNLHALGVGTLRALGVIGDDGEGYELQRALRAMGVDLSDLLVREDRFTPTYTKPMRQTPEGEIEMERQDIKNRSNLPADIEDELLKRLENVLPKVDAVVMLDQVDERNHGVLTDRVRDAVAEIAKANPEKTFFVDSRCRIREFRNVIIKPNRYEAAEGSGAATDVEVTDEKAIEAAKALSKRNGRPVFLTLNEKGIAVVDGDQAQVVSGVHVTGPIDIVGAGDSVTAGVTSSLVAGASLAEAAAIGNVVASVTIRQIGTTGTCPIPELHAAFEKVAGQYRDL